MACSVLSKPKEQTIERMMAQGEKRAEDGRRPKRMMPKGDDGRRAIRMMAQGDDGRKMMGNG